MFPQICKFTLHRTRNDYTEITVTTKEQQYRDMCNSCGDCVCSNSLEPRYKTYSCPADEVCGDCGESGGTVPNGGSTGGVND